MLGVTAPDRWQSQPEPELYTRVVPGQELPPPVLPTVAANWYPDPTAPGVLRYWDGVGWTEHRQAAAPPQATATVVNNVNVRAGGGSNAGLHLVLTILTCGLWLPVWILIEIVRAVSK
jgi:hypothetical protein